MEPISALAFACNILELVGIAIETGKAIKEIYESPSGTREKEQDLQWQAETLDTILKGLQDARAEVNNVLVDSRMKEISTKSIFISLAIQKIVEKCKRKDKSIMSATKSAFQLWLQKSDIEDLQTELEKQQKALSNLTTTQILVDVGKLKNQLQYASQRMESQMQHAGEQQGLMLESLYTLDSHLRDVAKTEPVLEQLKTIYDAVTGASDGMRVIRLLEVLRFPSMNDRFHDVRDSAPETFEWLFNNPEYLLKMQPGLTISFSEWLRTGSGIFHIEGKPGSGKSTLMKFICEHDSKMTLLKEWAGDRKLIDSQFFFWRIGSREEKSLGGLVRGLISSIIQQNPHLARVLFPRLWDPKDPQNSPVTARMELGEKEVLGAFDRLTQERLVSEQHRICFFIDGLDEFDESHGYTCHDLTLKLKKWVDISAGHIKFCVSSRMLLVFNNAFNSSQRITIQKFTEGDIQQLVKQKLEDNDQFKKLRETEEENCMELKQQILDNADGVFLWVTVLLNLLEDALISKDTMKQLQSIVTDAPAELNAFFRHILDSIPNRYRRNSFILLALSMRKVGILLANDARDQKYIFYDDFYSDLSTPMTLLSCSYLLEMLEEREFLDADKDIPEIFAIDMGEVEKRTELAKTKVLKHCRGLLEFRDEADWTVVIFTHRSIPEFLQQFFNHNSDVHGLVDRFVGELLAWMYRIEIQYCQNIVIAQQRKHDHHLDVSESSFEYTISLVAKLRQTPLEKNDLTCRLLHAIDKDLLRNCWSTTDLRELPEKAYNWGMFVDDDNTTSIETISCLSAASVLGLHEYIVWYIKEASTPPIEQIDWYYLNILQPQVMGFDDTDLPTAFANIVIRELFRAGLSPNTILQHNFLSNGDTVYYGSLKKMRMIGEGPEATRLLEAQLPEYRSHSLDEICDNGVHSGEKSSGNARVQENAGGERKASGGDVGYEASASRDTTQRYNNSGDNYSKYSVNNNPSGDRKEDQSIKENVTLVAGIPEQPVCLVQENNNSKHDNDDKANSNKENVSHSDSDPVKDSHDDLVDTSFQYGEIRRRHTSKLIRDEGESEKPNHKNNCKLTIWHGFARSTCFEFQKNNLRKDEPSPILWTLAETWLEFGADPRIVFSRKSNIETEEMHKLGRRLLITMDTVDGVNIAVAVEEEDTGSPTRWTQNRRLAPLLAKLFEAHDGSFSMEDYVRFFNPPNCEKLLELMERNRRVCDEADRVRAENALNEKSMGESLINTTTRKLSQIVAFGGFFKSWLLLSFLFTSAVAYLLISFC